jgi:hypothetical protein
MRGRAKRPRVAPPLPLLDDHSVSSVMSYRLTLGVGFRSNEARGDRLRDTPR